MLISIAELTLPGTTRRYHLGNTGLRRSSPFPPTVPSGGRAKSLYHLAYFPPFPPFLTISKRDNGGEFRREDEEPIQVLLRKQGVREEQGERNGKKVHMLGA
jgi:hypothetical protein